MTNCIQHVLLATPLNQRLRLRLMYNVNMWSVFDDELHTARSISNSSQLEIKIKINVQCKQVEDI